MLVLLFIFYLLICCWLLIKLPAFRHGPLKRATVVILFLIKIAAGEFYGYFYAKAKSGDTWNYHYAGLEQKQLLIHQPILFFKEIFITQYAHGYQHLFETVHSYWNNLSPALIEKLLAVFDLFSGSNYYINVIFYSLLVFIGQLYLFRFFYNYSGNKLISACCTFLIPSVLFWCSGIHKDGLLLMFLGCLLYAFNKMIIDKINFKRIIIFLIGLIGIFLLRNMLLLLLIPALLSWWLSSRMHKRNWLAYIIIYLLSGLLFFNLGKINTHLDLPAKVALRQQEFKQLSGQSSIPLSTLSPTAMGFIKNAPQALCHTLLRPFPWEGNNILYRVSGLETMIFFLLLLSSLVLIIVFRREMSSFLLFNFFLALTGLLIIGYIVPFIGAFIRYRSLFLPFLLFFSLMTILKFLQETTKNIRILFIFKNIEEII